MHYSLKRQREPVVKLVYKTVVMFKNINPMDADPSGSVKYSLFRFSGSAVYHTR